MANCPACQSAGQQGSFPHLGDCDLLQAAYILAGLAMMLNIRLSYSSAPYALIRFKLPENLFSVFVRRMASALELWCLPSMLLGNIMDLIQKLIDENPELRAIIEKADQIQQKANDLKGTAGTQSTSELSTIKSNDIQGQTAPAGVKAKATSLKEKAGELHRVAGELEAAAQDSSSPLKDLRVPAERLKGKAGNSTDGTDHLYYAANQLAGHSGGAGLDDLATAVITRFDAVKGYYEALMAEATRIQKQSDSSVTPVEREYNQLKAIYDEMINFTKLKTKATALKSAAQTQSSTELTQATIGGPATTLATKAQNLSEAANGLSSDPQLTSQAGLLATAAKKTGPGDKTSLHYHAGQLQSNPTQYEKAKDVILAFDTLKGLYDALITAAIQHNKLSDPKVNDVESKYKELTTHYDGMLKFTKIRYYSEQIETLAGTLRTSGNSGDAEKIVRYFESMNHAYSKLPEENNVKTPFLALKNAYDLMLNVTKMKQPATNLEAVATTLKSNKTVPYAHLFKVKYDEFKEVFDKAAPTAQNAVKPDWNNLKDLISGAMKWWKFYWIIAPSIICQWLNFLTYVLLLIVYLMGGDQGHLTIFYLVIAISGVVFGINMTLVYSVDYFYIPVYIVGENCFPALTSFIHYVSTLIFGNRRKWNSDYLLVKIDIWVAIIISFVAAVVWTVGYLCEGSDIGQMKHIFAYGFSGEFKPDVISPFLMIVVGMGLVYAIYPGIAPGMIVPFYLIDKIEMVLLIATIFPPVIIAILRKYKPSWSPQHYVGPGMGGWKEHKAPEYKGGGTVYGQIWHFFDILMIIKISLAAIFIYSLHYRESSIARSIINQPKMSTFLSIVFYMCHEILLALGFSGFIGNDGGDFILIPQYIGALFMIFLAFYSEGYIIEYKSHDPQNWPTEGISYVFAVIL